MAVLRPRIRVEQRVEVRATPTKKRARKSIRASLSDRSSVRRKPGAGVKKEPSLKVEVKEETKLNDALNAALLPSGNPLRPPHPLLKLPSDLHFGLIQESLAHNLFHMLIQTCLWNQTRGLQARPVLLQVLTLYPTPELLAGADLQQLTEMLRPIGLHNIRAQRLIKFAKTWLDCPPERGKRYRRVDYPVKGCGRDVKPNEVLDELDPRQAWEVAHLPGVGAYALDSYRIFVRDRFRAVDQQDGVEPEWKSVVPLDKPLRAYLVWKWKSEGWAWDPLTGKKRRIDSP